MVSSVLSFVLETHLSELDTCPEESSERSVDFTIAYVGEALGESRKLH